MAKNLSNNGIVLNQTIYPQHVSQSVDAFTGADDYDITVSGSFTVTGSTSIQGDVDVDGSITIYGNVVAPNLTNTAQTNVVTFNPVNGQLYYTASNAISPASASYAISASVADSAISASYSTTASFAQNAISASYALSASHADLADTASFITASGVFGPYGSNSVVSSSYALSASYSVSASYATTASYVENAQTASYVENAQTASFITASGVFGPHGSNSVISSSYALTASYLTGYVSPFPFTGSAQITGSLGVTGSATINGDLVVNGTASFNVFHTTYNSSSIIYASGSTKFGDTSDDTHQFTGSLSVSGSITADSFTGTASYATQAATASFVTLAQTASYVANAQTASYVLNAVSSSFATTASYAVTASHALTASFVTTAQTASFITASGVFGPYGSNSVISSSYALTASHVTGIVAAFPYTGSAQITGSLGVTGSVDIYKSGSNVVTISGSTGPLVTVTDSNSGPLLTVATGSTNILVVDSSLVTTITGSLNVQSGVTASLFGTASWALNAITSSHIVQAVSASYSATASYVVLAQTASYVANAQTASYVLNAVSASYATTASYVNQAISASYATTASYAVSSSYAVTASYALNALSSSYAATSSLSDRTTQTDILALNNSGFTIEKGMVVRITGSNNASDIPRITTASYETDGLSANTLGIATQQITNGSQGFIITEGVLTGIDTTNYISGQLVFLGASGAITGSAPTAPLHTVRLGQIIRQQSNNGSMHVRIDNGYELGEMHDTLDTSTTTSYGDMLVKSGSVWINSKQLTGSYGLTGSLTATSFTGSLFGTASYATQAATASFVTTAQTASYVLNAVSASFASTASFVTLAQTASFVTTAQTASYVLNAVSASFASTASYVNQLNQAVLISGSLNATGSVNIYKSGSTVVAVSGSNGPLFDIADVVSGSLFTVWTGSNRILQTNSDYTTILGGASGATALFATNKATANSGSTTLYTVPTATYDSIHVDYNIRSGSTARAGNIFAIWSGSSVNQIETSASSFGDTSTFTFGVLVSGSNLALTGSTTTNGWTVKTIIRSI